MPRPERRGYKRVSGVFRVTLKMDVNVNFDFTCDSRDISESGMRLVLLRKLIPGSQVSVEFNLPRLYHYDELKIAAEVVWVLPSAKDEGKFETGIRFTALDPVQQERLKEYVRKGRL